MENKVCIITGANAGIGFATALKLAEKGAHVILACRNEAKATEAVHEIRSRTGNAKVEFMHVDLLQFDSVKRFCDTFRSRKLPLHVLINNAGILMGSADGWYTADGNNSVLQVNYLSHFLLTLSLLDIMQATPGETRVVNLASLAHRFGWIDFADVNGTGLTGCLCYSQSKLANIMFTRELAKRLGSLPGNSVTVNAADPDSVYSCFYDNLPTCMRLCFRPFLGLMKTIEQGAETPVFVASSPSVAGTTGGHYFRCKPTRPSETCFDQDKCKQLFDMSFGLVNWEKNKPSGVKPAL